MRRYPQELVRWQEYVFRVDHYECLVNVRIISLEEYVPNYTAVMWYKLVERFQTFL